MQALEKLYEKPSASNKIFLMKRLFNMRMSENGSIVNHLNDFNGVTTQLKTVGINFDDEIRALLFLCSLPDSWNNLVTTVSNPTVSGTLTLNDVASSVMNDEMRRKMTSDDISSSTALSMESRDRQNNRGRSPTRRRSKSRGKSKSKGRAIVCWNCNKEDDASRNTWVYAISQKSDVYHTIKKWKTPSSKDFIILTLYVDDILVASSSMGRINELKKELASTFSMKNLGDTKQLLGMRTTRDKKQRKLLLSQEEYIENVLRRFNLHNSKPVTTPLAAHSKLSKELSPKTREDEEYMAQKSVALSKMEAEYVAVTEACKDVIWLQGLLIELGYGQVDCKLRIDSQSAIHLANNLAFHSRTKHIQLRPKTKAYHTDAITFNKACPCALFFPAIT
ncbi:hypothetical protein RJ639_017871 [Escallonia herrerae]|uniref:Reverse transcriptase Ty1/copia-type domain-containing protein n=1 Tax=Escallonia herrerae TaxID=1293975 RepID=A0AA88VAK2_9ASTE|nr:hypothetical protein RJ639_017871 [Escallonia herrerae]